MADIVRADGRAYNELRKLSSEQGLLEAADGSAKVSQGGTIVVAGVFGPTRVPRVSDEDVSSAVLSVTFRPSSSRITAPQHEEVASHVASGLSSVLLASLYPRTAIKVVLQAVCDDGSLLAAALNAGYLALVDAGIEVTGLLGAVSLSYTTYTPNGRHPDALAGEDGVDELGVMQLAPPPEGQEASVVLLDPSAAEEVPDAFRAEPGDPSASHAASISSHSFRDVVAAREDEEGEVVRLDYARIENVVTLTLAVSETSVAAGAFELLVHYGDVAPDVLETLVKMGVVSAKSVLSFMGLSLKSNIAKREALVA